jgi:ACS family sodium-dependent inorganic phosphate cotransporter
MHCLWSKWSPPYERSQLATFAFSGSYIGSLVALSLGGLIAEHINWQAIFYLFGSFGVLWSVLWFIYIFESPANHAKIHIEERLYIESSLVKSPLNSTSIPWKLILTSAPVWAIVFAHFSENWSFYTFLTEMPTFLSETIHYKIDKAGLISSLPYLLMAIMLYSAGYFSDYLLKTNKLSYTIVRKIFCCSGLIAQSFFMIIMALTTNKLILIICINLSFHKYLDLNALYLFLASFHASKKLIESLEVLNSYNT